MNDRLWLEGFSLRPQGGTLTLRLRPGESMAVLGPPAAGKSRFLRTIMGWERPAQGQVHVSGGVALAALPSVNRRTTVEQLARRASGEPPNDAARALGATGLWDARRKLIGQLTPTQAALCEIMILLASRSDLLLIDGQLDRVDLWSWAPLWSALVERLKGGGALVVVTHRTELVNQFDWIVALKDGEPRFAGSPEDLRREAETEIEVVTENQLGVRALTEPFHVRIQETEEGLRLQAAEGQQLAARLLLEGYGDVKLQIVRRPGLDEALRRRIR